MENTLVKNLKDQIKREKTFLNSIIKHPQLYYYKLGNCIYERLYANNNCFDITNSKIKSTRSEKELITLNAKKINY